MTSLLAYLYKRPELISNKLYFLEISFAAVLLPLADSPSQAIISFFEFFHFYFKNTCCLIIKFI